MVETNLSELCRKAGISKIIESQYHRRGSTEYFGCVLVSSEGTVQLT